MTTRTAKWPPRCSATSARCPADQLKLKPFHGVEQGTIVGQEGLEYYYDRYLRGKAGVERVEVNANGYPVPSRLAPTLPQAGHSLQVTLDMGLQKEAEKALLEGIDNARAGGKPAVAGAFVAMDPRNGEILALGSYPSFNPNRFVKPMTEHEYEQLRGQAAGPPARSPTGPSTAPIRPAPRSSRSPPWRRWKAA